MVKGLKLEPEVKEILGYIDADKNFLLSGGAGSGKTYSLIQVIKQVIEKSPYAKIACITYTNAAVKEIEARVDNSNLVVSTIHEFLWNNIRLFQKELKITIVELVNQNSPKIKNPLDHPITKEYLDRLEEGIQYKDYSKIQQGVISHDEVLIIANYMFEKYSLLSDILKDKYKFIFIDEYQDTAETVIEIFLEHLMKSKRKNIVGLFGDSMQSIYDAGIGDVNKYIGEGNGSVVEVRKTQNRRNPKSVIDLANKLRTDGIEQVPSKDLKAPNMIAGEVKKGTIKFCYSKEYDIELLKKSLEWDFTNSKQTKILNLTYNLIAPKAGFQNLMEIYSGDRIIAFKNRIRKYIKDKEIETDFSSYTFGQVIEFLQRGKNGAELKNVSPTNAMESYIESNQEWFECAKMQNYSLFSKLYVDKEQLIDDKKQDSNDENKKNSKRDDLIKHLYRIAERIMFYDNKRFNEFIRATDYKIYSISDKRNLKNQIEELKSYRSKTIGEIVDKADEFGICIKGDKFMKFINEKEYVYSRVKKLNFSEFINLYNYLEGFTPFSTQHKTKGTEFDNVLVILDNGGWNNYNFKGLFGGTNSASVEARTKKIFYVCCTRAKENLAVYFHNPSTTVVETAIELFGKDNLINFDHKEG